jgi:hypothetical protein
MARHRQALAKASGAFPTILRHEGRWIEAGAQMGTLFSGAVLPSDLFSDDPNLRQQVEKAFLNKCCQD